MSVTISQGGLTWDANINMANFQAQMDSIQRQIQGLTTSSQKEADAIENLVKKAAGAMAAYTAFSAASNFVSDVVKVRGEFQDLNTAFQTMLGSKERADKLMASAVQLAQTTPFDLQSVASGAKQLLAYGFAADDITDNLKMLGNIASGVGTDLNGLVYLYGTLRTSGRVTIMDLQQFAGRGVPIFEELAKQLGVASSEIRGMVSDGKVGFPQIEKAFQSMTGSGGMFFNLMEKQSKNLNGAIANMKDAWAKFQNELGKSSEGTISGAIRLTTSLIDHYEDVLKVLGVLVTTYGSYKAAVIATTAVQAIQTSVTQGYTIAETLRYRAMLISEAAMRALNRTMLANPAVLVTAGIAALVSALIIFRDKTIEVKTAQELLADAQKEVGDKMAETRAKIEPYLEALNKANVSEADRVSIYEKLKDIDPKIVEGLTAKTIAYDKLKTNVDKYLASLRDQIRMEANKEAATASIKQEEALQAQIDSKQKKLDELNAKIARANSSYNPYGGGGTVGASAGAQRLKQEIALLEEKKRAQEEVTKSFGKQIVEEIKPVVTRDPNAGKTNKQIIDEKTSLEELATFRKTLEENYQKEKKESIRVALAEDLKYADERKKFLDIYGAEKKAVKDLQKEEKGINSLLEERKGIIEAIQALQRDAKQSGLTRDLSEIDRLNEKYDLAIQKVTDYNNKVAAFNQKHGTSAQGIGADQLAAIQQARKTEIGNAESKASADRYIKSLEDRQTIFEKFAEAQKNFGIEKAEEMYSAQTRGFESYLDFLNEEAAKLAPVIAMGLGDVGDEKRFTALLKEIADARKKIADQEAQDMARLFQETATFNQKKTLLDAQYQKDLSTLRKKFQGEDLAAQERNLQLKHDKEQDALLESFRPQTELYKRLNENILGFTRDRIKKELKYLKDTLKSGVAEDADGKLKALSPEQMKMIEDAIKKLQAFQAASGKVFGKTSEELSKMANGAHEVASILSSLSDAIAPLSPGLSDAASQLSDLANMAGNVFSGMASLASGDIAGAVQSAVNIIGSVVKVFAEAKRTAKEAKDAVAEFYQAIQFGEISSAIAIRERMLLEAQTNKLTLERLAAQKKALDESKRANQEQATALLKQLQQEQFIADERTKKGKGSPLFGLVGYLTGLGGKTKVEQELQSLAGKSFDDIEKLFNSGQLTESATKLFEQLQKLKQEGVDIDRQLKELAEETKQIFTATTADSLSDSLIEMFKQGKISTQDFADFFKEKMSDAALNIFKNKVVAEQMQRFYEEFAAAAQSGSELTNTEIATLQSSFLGNMESIKKQFEQLQKITGLSFNASMVSGGGGNSLKGAIKGITEPQAELLAGQFGGLRITAREQLDVAMRSLQVHQKIEFNTAATVQKLSDMLAKLDHYYRDYGIKIR